MFLSKFLLNPKNFNVYTIVLLMNKISCVISDKHFNKTLIF